VEGRPSSIGAPFPVCRSEDFVKLNLVRRSIIYIFSYPEYKGACASILLVRVTGAPPHRGSYRVGERGTAPV